MVKELDLDFFSWRDFIAGWTSGVCSISIGFPFETLKVRQQMTREFATVSQHAKLMLKKEGIRSFFRGISYPIWTTGILNSLYFGFYANSLRTIEYYKNEGSFKNCCDYGEVYRGWHWHCFYAGCIGGTVSTIVNTPIELAKTVLQAHSKKEKNNQGVTTSYLLNQFKNRGLRGCYHGGVILFIRDVPTFGLYAVCYEHVACVLKKYDSNALTRMLYEGIAGGISGVVTWFVAIPVDVIKSRYMSDCENVPRLYTGTIDCIQKTYNQQGISAFYRGMWIALLRAFPVNLVCFMVYEQTLRIL